VYRKDGSRCATFHLRRVRYAQDVTLEELRIACSFPADTHPCFIRSEIESTALKSAS